MTERPVIPDLGALSAKLRADDQHFRRTFALGPLADASSISASSTVPRLTSGDRVELRVRLLSLIEDRTGIDASTGATDRIDPILATMSAQEMVSWLNILEMEPLDGPSWIALIDAVTIHETYFFRDPDQLNFMRRTILTPTIIAQRSEKQPHLTCWCAGCSTGEEVYSLAILIVEALREVGEADLRSDGRILIQPRWRIMVLGTDIDRLALSEAATANYEDFPMGPFRCLPESLLAYFEPPVSGQRGQAPQRKVRPEIRALTNFRPFNLAATQAPTGQVHLILCRNVLIYLSDRTRSQAQALFHQALNKDGALVLGPTDVLRQPDLFAPVWGPGTVLYRKK